MAETYTCEEPNGFEERDQPEIQCCQDNNITPQSE